MAHGRIAHFRRECRRCGELCTPQALADHHGSGQANCTLRKWWAWLAQNDWWYAGNYGSVLELAGQTRILPAMYEEVRVEVEGGLFTWDRYAHYVRCSPRWLIKLAKELTHADTPLVVAIMGPRHMPDKVKHAFLGGKQPPLVRTERRLPLKLRAKVIRAAAESPMSRELIFDDVKSAVKIIQGAWL